MTLRTAARIAGFVVIFAALAVAWAALAPPQLGGSTRYVMLDGTSMEPSLHAGDLAVVRPRDSVEQGDVVLYHHAGLGVHVLHRIVAFGDGKYVLKGDNNDFLDDVQPTADEITGGLWFSVPRAGSAIVWAREPLHAALMVFTLAFLALGGGAAVSRVRRQTPTRSIAAAAPREHRPTSGWSGVAYVLLGVGLAGLAFFGLFAALSYSRPSTRVETVPDAYAHVGSFSYRSSVPVSDVYPDGLVDTGDSVFLQLVPALDLAFDYRLEAPNAHDVRGVVGLTAVLSDGAGWTRRIPVGEAATFDGTTGRAEGSLDIAALGGIVDELRALTGSATTTFSLAIVADVKLGGRVGDEPVTRSFSPQLPLLLDTVSVHPNASSEDATIFSARQAETTTVRSPSSVSIGVAQLSVGDARHVALIGLALAVLLSAVGGVALLLSRSNEARVSSLFGDRLIAIAGPPAIESDRVTELVDAESLRQIAEQYNRVILHWREGRGHVYQVDEGGSLYRYRSGLGLESERSAERMVEEDTLVHSSPTLPPRAATG